MAEYAKTEAMDWARQNLRGQWTTLMTPFTPDDEVDEEGLRRNVRQRQHLFGGGVGDVGADRPVAPGLVADDVVHASTLLARQAPELAHRPCASTPMSAQRADMANVSAQPLFVDLIVGCERGHEGRPLAAQVLTRPVHGLAFRVLSHNGASCPSSGYWSFQSLNRASADSSCDGSALSFKNDVGS